MAALHCAIDRSKVLWTFGMLALSAGIGFVDRVTSPEMSFSVFYLVPVAVGIWKSGLWAGVVLSVASTVIWFMAGNEMSVRPSLLCWNAGVRLSFFVLTSVVLERTRRLTASLDQKAASLIEENDMRKRVEQALTGNQRVLEAIAQGKTLAEVLRQLVTNVSAWSEQFYGSILVRDAEARPSLHQATAGLGSLSGEGDSNSANRLEAQPACDEAAGQKFEEQAALEREWRAYGERALKRGLQQAYAKPVLSTLGEELGFVAVYVPSEYKPGALDHQLFEKTAHLTSIALERERSEKMLRRLSSLILNAQEAERRRVSRELHDGVNQILGSVAFRVEAILAEIPPRNQAIHQEVAKVRILLQKAIHEVQNISENLRPSELDELGLPAALRELVGEFKERNRMAVDLEAPAALERFPSEVELGLYRIVQEGLRNVEKHSAASQVWLSLDWDNSAVFLKLKDNGKGLAHAGLETRKRPGMGLVDMRERCAFLGGTFALRSEPESGTEIAVRIPRNAGRPGATA